jgi:hypothetical protein
MKRLIPVALLAYSAFASAQWAVYDKSVHEELQKINKVEGAIANFDTAFKSSLSSGNAGQDLTLGDGSAKAILKGLDTKFEALEITDEEKLKYIGTEQDCGSNNEKFLKHYNACVGLRNLRLQTLKQSQEALKVLDQRRQQIVKLIKDSRNVTEKSGQLQRYQFELQALQSLMQTDAMQLQVLMDGYKQREQVYAMQMVEAKRASDTGQFDSGTGKARKKAVPFVMP